MSGARLAVKVVVSLSFPRDLHPLHSHQLAWRTTILPPAGIDPYWIPNSGEIWTALLPEDRDFRRHRSPTKLGSRRPGRRARSISRIWLGTADPSPNRKAEPASQSCLEDPAHQRVAVSRRWRRRPSRASMPANTRYGSVPWLSRGAESASVIDPRIDDHLCLGVIAEVTMAFNRTSADPGAQGAMSSVRIRTGSPSAPATASSTRPRPDPPG